MSDDERRSDENILIVGWNASRNFGTTLQSLALYDVVSARYGCSLLWERRYLPFGDVLKHLLLKKSRYVAKPQFDDASRRKALECYSAASKVTVNSKRELADVIERFSVFMVGGDQLWNPYLCEKTYFLDFVPDGKRKISYGTSIGMSALPPECEKRYKKALARFDYIAVRDAAGAKSLSVLFADKPVSTVADPVFLLSARQWSEFAQGGDTVVPEPGYTLLYFVGDGDNAARAERSARSSGQRTVLIPMRDSDAQADVDLVPTGIGPKEFIKLVTGAGKIYTDSYHMSAFALMFAKPFTVYKRFPYGDACDPNSRIDELLCLFGAGGARTAETFEPDLYKCTAVIDGMRERSLDILFGEIEGRRE